MRHVLMYSFSTSTGNAGQTWLRMILLHMTSWLLGFAGVAYSTLRNMKSCFVFQVNSSRTSASSFTTSRACALVSVVVHAQMDDCQHAAQPRAVGDGVQEKEGLPPARGVHPVIDVTPLPPIPLISCALTLQALQADHLQVNVVVRSPQAVCVFWKRAGVSLMVAAELGAGGGGAQRFRSQRELYLLLLPTDTAQQARMLRTSRQRLFGAKRCA